MIKAVCPGTFDPITNGHVDLVQRALGIFDEIVIAVTTASHKKPLFDIGERLALIKGAVSQLEGVTVEAFDGLLVDYVKKKGASSVIRGLRAISDFEYELQMAHMNRRLDSEVETVFMMPSEEYSFITSTIVREVSSLGGSLRDIVPENVERALREKYEA